MNTATTTAVGDLVPQMERFSYDDGIVRKFLFASVIWGLVGMLVGLIAALQLAAPVFNSLGLEGNWTQIFSFGRLRPLHTNAVIFAFAGNGIFAAVYYSSQRLLKTRMFSDKLSKLHFWGWQAIIVSAAVTLPLGLTQGKEYAELEWPIDIAITLIWVVFAINFFGTLAVRRERHIYVALWFYIATIVAIAVLHIFNNIWVIAGPFKSYSVYAGAQDAFMQWWYGHNAVAFFLTTPFLGLMYYFLPKAAGRPVFSYKLSILHFWSLVFIYIWAGPHHLHYTAIPEWASTLGMLFSVILWMPSWGGMLNGLLTLRGAWDRVAKDPVLKFFVVGITFYGMSTFEGPLLSIKAVNGLSHYTDWTIAHVHAGALGWVGYMVFGMAYWLIPRLFQTKGMANAKWVEWHFWLSTIGILIYIVAIYIAGLTQGLMWRSFTPEGALEYGDFMETVTVLIPMYWIRVVGGTLYLLGTVLCLMNMVKTWKQRPTVYDEPVYEAPALAKTNPTNYVTAPSFKPTLSKWTVGFLVAGLACLGLYLTGDEATPEKSRMYLFFALSFIGLGVMMGMGKTINYFAGMKWHRRWEGRPIGFTIWVAVAVVTASLFEIVPTFAIESNVKSIEAVKPLTPLELYGRDIYVAEGCYNCHSQMVRPLHFETERFGDYSKAGEFVYDHPFQWGSRRIGPDLARVGVRLTSASWHVRHMIDPRATSETSIMPSYGHLAEEALPYDVIPSRVGALKLLGVYDQNDYMQAAENAKVQAAEVLKRILAEDKGMVFLEDTKMLAMVAYLLRLGTDTAGLGAELHNLESGN
ncbi:MAG: cytochrome-c oxidase, cbb3-type subunit I [Planctomycetes bacterium]|nr:cytochrome-c oxidase, cbb3-type subunit I [Planctomycetota bacterium]